MEELSIEEKAKAYDEALERARIWKDKSGMPADKQGILDDIFPELAGSEDEQIRKELTKHLKEGVEGYMPAGDSSDYRRWLDWLEKQGKSSDQIHYWTEEEIEPIISDYLRGAEHYGGMIARLRCLKPKSLEKQSEFYTKRDVDNAYIEGMASAKRELEKQDEQKPAVEMKTPEESLGIDSNTYNEIVDECIYGEQKSQRMISAEAKEAMYAKTAWSEEDEKIFDRICALIHSAAYKNYDVDEDGNECGEYANIKEWFKKLKDRVQPQITWKSSDEQMATLYKYAEQNNYDGSILTSLYNDLKKLREK